MIEQLRDGKNVVTEDGDVRSRHDLIDDEIPEATPWHRDATETEEIPEVVVDLAEARRIITRVEDEAEKHLGRMSVEEAEHMACTQLNISYEAYSLALEQVYEARRAESEASTKAVGAQGIKEAIRAQQRAGMSESEAQLYDAQNRAHDENQKPGVGRPRY